MKRILPSQVLEAYAKTGLRPVRGKFVKRDKSDAVCGACALGACSMAKVSIPEFLHEMGGPISSRAALALDLDLEYVDGFMGGFDGDEDEVTLRRAHMSEPYVAGVRDGMAAWRAVTEAGMVP